jgi:secondary thiamine-phosphate synthase enzyme
MIEWQRRAVTGFGADRLARSPSIGLPTPPARSTPRYKPFTPCRQRIQARKRSHCQNMFVDLRIDTHHHREFIDVTDRVREVVASSPTRRGLCLVFSPHTTAGVTLNENADPDVVNDLLGALHDLVGDERRFKHAEGNSGGHLLTSLVGPSVTLPIRDGALALGRWQAVYLCEFDGPRQRTLNVQVVRDGSD